MIVEREAISSAADRYPIDVRLSDIPSASCGRELIELVLAREYERIGFTPPHPTWPVAAGAFVDADNYTPRRLIELIELVDRHAQMCASEGAVRELTNLTGPDAAEPKQAPEPEHARNDEALDERFEVLRQSADVPTKSDDACQVIGAVDARILYLPPYWSDLQPDGRACFSALCLFLGILVLLVRLLKAIPQDGSLLGGGSSPISANVRSGSASISPRMNTRPRTRRGRPSCPRSCPILSIRRAFSSSLLRSRRWPDLPLVGRPAVRQRCRGGGGVGSGVDSRLDGGLSLPQQSGRRRRPCHGQG